MHHAAVIKDVVWAELTAHGRHTHHEVENLAGDTTKAHEDSLLVVQAHKEAVTVNILQENDAS